jgi:hypothetical protein
VETPGKVARSGRSAILEDPTGQRARWMRWTGRVVFVVFLCWLLAIVVGGLGLLPVPRLPLTHVLRASQEPPPLSRLPRPKPPSASDLRPAIPARAFAERVANAKLHSQRVRANGQSSSKPGRSNSHPRGRSATAPGHLKAIPPTTTRGRSPTAPHGRNTTAPGQTKTTTSAIPPRGRSATAPGRTTIPSLPPPRP